MSANLPAYASAGSSILQMFGAFTAASGAKKAGKSTQDAREFEAAQLRQAAGQSIAASQREAAEERRKARLVTSRAIAVTAASGGGVSDVTVQKVISDLDAEGAYRSLVALYQGEEKARQLRLAAKGKEYEGKLARAGAAQQASAYQIAGAAAGLKGLGSFYLKYGRGGPSGTQSSGDSALITDSIDTGNLA